MQFPLTIKNTGEQLTFLKIEKEGSIDKVYVEGEVKPGKGPAMHTHFLQDEQLTVVSGKMGYQFWGSEQQFALPGESVLFEREQPHRFWNAGEEMLKIEGWVGPVHNFPYFLSKVYEAQTKSGEEQPEMFDAAFLLTRYSSEYDMPEIPGFVKKVIMPITVIIGKLLGKYKHFKDAPAPVK